MPATLPRRATAIVAAVALAGFIATVLMIIRADQVPPVNFLHRVDDPRLGIGELRVTIAESDAEVLVVYGGKSDAAPERCSILWVYDIPLQRVPDTAPRQEFSGISWRPLWETTVEGPAGGQEVFTSCAFDPEIPGRGNYFVGPRELPQDSADDWRLAAVITGSASVAFVLVVAIVLALRSARPAASDVR